MRRKIWRENCWLPTHHYPSPLACTESSERVRDVWPWNRKCIGAGAPPYNLSPPFFLTGNLKHHLRRSQSHKKYRDFGPDANAMDDNLSNRTHNLRNNRVAPTRTVCAKFWSCMRDRLLGARTNNNILLENKLRLELKNGSNGQFVISPVVL